MESKVTRLEALAQIVSVPAFIVVTHATKDKLNSFLTSGIYICRSVTLHEDGERHSGAGQSATSAPVMMTEVHNTVAALLKKPDVVQVIVQEFVAESSGVAFVQSHDDIYVEYSCIREGVTSGIVKPFVAVLPANLPVYDQLTKALLVIYDIFGACDVEFVGVADPTFVQVRPISTAFTYDRALCMAKMQLQEITSTHTWVKNELTNRIGEYGEGTAAFWSAYKGVTHEYYRDVFKRKVDLNGSLIGIASTYYLDADCCKDLQLTWHDIVRLVISVAHEPSVLTKQPNQAGTLREVIRRSLIVAFAHGLVGGKYLYAVREQYRVWIAERLGEARSDIPMIYSKYAFGDLVALDHKQKVWTDYGPRDDYGIVVVPGTALNNGPFMTYEVGKKYRDVVLITEYLYPEIGQSICDLRGIICRNGALTSHVAILAREYGVPLIIHSDYEPE